MSSEHDNYDSEPADNDWYTPRRRAVGDSHDFRPVAHDMTAPLARLLTAGIAACSSDTDTERWFGSARSIRELRRICQHCPLMQPCHDYALKHDVEGFWGGTTHLQRKHQQQAQRIKPETVTFNYWIRQDA